MRFPDQDTPQAAYLQALMAFPLKTDCLQQMTLPRGLVAVLCAGLVAGQVPGPLQVPVGFHIRAILG